MGQIANQMFIEAIFKLKEKIKERNAEKKATSTISKKKTKKRNKFKLNKIAARWPARAVAQFYFID